MSGSRHGLRRQGGIQASGAGRLAATGAAVLLACAIGSATAAQRSATAPTADLPAVEIDRQWIEANRKFDAAREEQLAKVRAGALNGPFQPDWRSLQNYREPDWYRDAKFGIFIHWGVYSLPGFGNEWYSRNMYQPDKPDFAHHASTYGPQAKFGYKDLIPQFKAERFDPDAWAELFERAGARYVVPVAEHHDGFAMYDSRLSDWTAVKMGPQRDVLGDLSKAIRARGLHFGLSSHRAEHNWFFDGGRTFDSDVNDPRYAALYGPAHPHLLAPGKEDAEVAHDWTYVSQAFLDDWLARTGELVDAYQPELIYFDWWIGHSTFRNELATFAAYYYNQGAAHGAPVVINYKLLGMAEGSGTLDVERGQLGEIRERHWQTDTSISNKSWGYIENDTFKTPDFIVHMLADVVSKNGNLMLNVGPRGDGSIPDQARDVLLAIGDWLRANGEAIYGTSPWTRYGEGPTEVVTGTFQDTKTAPYTAEDFRFTTKDGALYAIQLDWPADGRALVRSIGRDLPVRKVTLLATGERVPFEQTGEGLRLTLPATQPPGVRAYAYRIDLK